MKPPRKLIRLTSAGRLQHQPVSDGTATKRDLRQLAPRLRKNPGGQTGEGWVQQEEQS
jgi:hypothetical protein